MGKKKPRKGGDDDWENDVEQMEAGDAPEAEPTKFKGLIFPHLRNLNRDYQTFQL